MTTTEPATRPAKVAWKDGIAEVQLPSGETRYRIKETVGKHADGKRQQVNKSFTTRKAAEAERDRIRHERNIGALIRPQDISVRALVAEFLATKSETRLNSKQSQKDGLRLLLATHGDRRAQDITHAHVLALQAAMRSGAARSSGSPGKPLAASTINGYMTKINALFAYAVRRKIMASNPCDELQRVPGPTKKEQALESRKAWGQEEGAALLAYVREAAPALLAPFALSLLGMRRGEVVGLAWDSVCLDGSWRPGLEDNVPTIAVGTPFLEIIEARVLVVNKAYVGDPKTDASARALPLPPEVVVLLTEHRANQLARAEEIGAAWTNSGMVVVDDLGAAIGIARYSNLFTKHSKAAGLPRIPVHGARNLAIQILENSEEGVPPVAASAWVGHKRAGITARYSRTTPTALAKAGRVLVEALGLTA